MSLEKSESQIQREKERKLALKQRREDLAFVANSAEGRRALLRLLRHCGYAKAGAPQSAKLYELGAYIAEELAQACPGHFITIIKELYELP